jgi:ubiquinol-cytochrome c reductase iron-sulfur subunit
MNLRKLLVALGTLLFGRWERRREEEAERERIVPAGSPNRGAENLVLLFLGLAVLFALGFIVAYAEFGSQTLPNELLGVCLGGAFACIATAFTIVAKRLVVTEELEDDYPEASPEAEAQVTQIVRESGSRFTRKRLLIGAGAATAGTLGAAVTTPALSLGPWWDTTPLTSSPWHRGQRLVDEDGKPYMASDIESGSFYTAFPQGADKELIGAPVVVVRVDPGALHLPAGREGWAPQGIVAYSKICTHAGCAIALYRKPLFKAVEPRPALVCPCHYSSFDPARGAEVLYGPAGRPLPQLPLAVDGSGGLRCGGQFSASVGPSWLNVDERPKA